MRRRLFAISLAVLLVPLGAVVSMSASAETCEHVKIKVGAGKPLVNETACLPVGGDEEPPEEPPAEEPPSPIPGIPGLPELPAPPSTDPNALPGDVVGAIPTDALPDPAMPASGRAEEDPVTDVAHTVAATLEDAAYTLVEVFIAVAEALEDAAYTLVDTVETGYETVKPVLDTVGPACVRQALPPELGGGTVQAGYCPSEE